MTDTATLGARSAELYYTYARAVDDGDLDGLRAIVTDDIRITRVCSSSRKVAWKYACVRIPSPSGSARTLVTTCLQTGTLSALCAR